MRLLLIAVSVWLAAAGPAAAQDDEPGSKDHPLIARMAGFYIYGYRVADFDAHEFTVADGAEPSKVEGRLWEIAYSLKEGAKRPSPLEILRNHRNAFAKIGAKQLFTDVHSLTMRADKPAALWIEVSVANEGEFYRLTIVQPAAMAQQLEVTATGLAKQLAERGSVAIHDILFDTGKATIKDESAAVIATIAELLDSDATLALEIQGHTDNVGQAAANLKLSQQRAAAVREALVTAHGVAASRLTATGFGDARPVGDNGTEEGRALNRRVELVKM